jgi:hypothetical protein
MFLCVLKNHFMRFLNLESALNSSANNFITFIFNQFYTIFNII